MKLRFAVRFLLTFSLLVPLWWRLDLGNLYSDALLRLVGWLSPAVNGWWLDLTASPPAFTRGAESLPLYLNLPAIAMGMMPLASLIVGTPGQSIRQITIRILLGLVLYFAVDAVVVLAYPAFMYDPDTIKDTVGVFSGMVAFVVAPLGIWFVVTYPTLRSLWQLAPNPAPPLVPDATKRRATRRDRRS